MSHFSVLVIGPDHEKQLAPYQENNMGDCPDEFMVFNDIEDEYLAKYHSEEIELVQLNDGTCHSRYDSRFKNPNQYKDGLFSKNPSHVYPIDSKMIKMKMSNHYRTFEEYMGDWCGHKERDEDKNRFGYWENPNQKWDWYEVGGRWTGFFKLRKNRPGKKGSPGLMTPEAKDGYADQLYIQDIDVAGMRDEAGAEALAKYTRFVTGIGPDFIKDGKPYVKYRWSELLENEKFKDLDIEEKRSIYWGQPLLKRIQALKDQHFEKSARGTVERDFWIWVDIEPYLCTEEEHVMAARNDALTTFAVLKDGKWYERGEMGWWGMVHDEKDKAKWQNEFNKLIDGLPPTTLLTVVDCHI